jgi:hypothetical protein
MRNPDSTTQWEHGPGAPVELLASSCGRTQHIGRQVHDSDRRTFEVMTLILNLHRPALKAYQCAYKKPLGNIASL